MHLALGVEDSAKTEILMDLMNEFNREVDERVFGRERRVA